MCGRSIITANVCKGLIWGGGDNNGFLVNTSDKGFVNTSLCALSTPLDCKFVQVIFEFFIDALRVFTD